jgi:hypothetical protein
MREFAPVAPFVVRMLAVVILSLNRVAIVVRRASLPVPEPKARGILSKERFFLVCDLSVDISIRSLIERAGVALPDRIVFASSFLESHCQCFLVSLIFSAETRLYAYHWQLERGDIMHFVVLVLVKLNLTTVSSVLKVVGNNLQDEKITD